MSYDYLTHYYFSLILYWSLSFEKYFMSYYHMRNIFCLSIIWAPPSLIKDKHFCCLYYPYELSICMSKLNIHIFLMQRTLAFYIF